MRLSLASVLIVTGLSVSPAFGQDADGRVRHDAKHDSGHMQRRVERAERVSPGAPRATRATAHVAPPAGRPGGGPPVLEQRRRGGGTVIVEGRGDGGRARGPRPRVYTTRPRVAVVPRRVYPYGGFGFGYYYDPFWYPWGGPWGYGGYPGYYGYPDGQRDDLGRVRLDVKGPHEAEVLVDGYYAGILDDFDGAFQGLDLESGAYRIEVMAEGYETLTFDTRVTDGRKLTLHGVMRQAAEPE